MMFVGFDPLILKHIVLGDLPKEKISNQVLSRNLENEAKTTLDGFNPCIYAQYLVDEQGESPSPKILEDILCWVEIYTFTDLVSLTRILDITPGRLTDEWLQLPACKQLEKASGSISKGRSREISRLNG